MRLGPGKRQRQVAVHGHLQTSVVEMGPAYGLTTRDLFKLISESISVFQFKQPVRYGCSISLLQTAAGVEVGCRQLFG